MFPPLCYGYINVQIYGCKLNFEKYPSLLLDKLMKINVSFLPGIWEDVTMLHQVTPVCCLLNRVAVI